MTERSDLLTQYDQLSETLWNARDEVYRLELGRAALANMIQEMDKGESL